MRFLKNVLIILGKMISLYLMSSNYIQRRIEMSKNDIKTSAKRRTTIFLLNDINFWAHAASRSRACAHTWWVRVRHLTAGGYRGSSGSRLSSRNRERLSRHPPPPVARRRGQLGAIAHWRAPDMPDTIVSDKRI